MVNAAAPEVFTASEPAPLVIAELQDFQAALAASGIALPDLSLALRANPKSVAAIVKTTAAQMRSGRMPWPGTLHDRTNTARRNQP